MRKKEQNLFHLLRATMHLKACLPQNAAGKHYERSEYMIIKAGQLIILDRRIKKYLKIACQDVRQDKHWRKPAFQGALNKVYLDTETFFYMASKFIDLFFEGINGLMGVASSEKRKLKSCQRILIARNNLIEHSHKPGQPAENEIRQFGLNRRYGIYLGVSRTGYTTLRNGMTREMLGRINQAIKWSRQQQIKRLKSQSRS